MLDSKVDYRLYLATGFYPALTRRYSPANNRALVARFVDKVEVCAFANVVTLWSSVLYTVEEIKLWLGIGFAWGWMFAHLTPSLQGYVFFLYVCDRACAAPLLHGVEIFAL